GGVPRISGAAGDGPLEHPRSRRRPDRAAGVRPRRRRARRADRVSVAHHRRRTPEGTPEGGAMTDTIVYVRYLVDDVQAAIDFYTAHLGFTTQNAYLPAFAEVRRGNLSLLLSGPTSSAGRPMPDGRTPEPGGWNRIHLLVDNIVAEVARLRTAGV